MIRCICVDDEPLARQGLKLALSGFADFKLIGEYSSADELIANYPADVDVVFLDIEMPRLNGLELLDRWPSKPIPTIIFVTAYSEYAIKAFEKEALDYVLKPIDENRFSKVIDRIRSNQHVEQNSPEKTKKLLQTIDDLRAQLVKKDPEFTIKTDEGYFRLRVADVLFIEGIGDHVCFNMMDRQLITRATLKKYVAEFSEHGFKQTHKSFLVNTNHVVKAEKLRFGDYLVTMSNQKTVRLSRRYKEAIDALTH